MKYTEIEQIEILLACDNATELLEAKEKFYEVQKMSCNAIKVYDSLMTLFLVTEKIVK